MHQLLIELLVAEFTSTPRSQDPHGGPAAMMFLLAGSRTCPVNAADVG
jgi:hypothetical protein